MEQPASGAPVDEAAFTVRHRQGEGDESRSRILIHGMNYAPELIGVGRYTGELAEYLAAEGHQVEVVTAAPHYPGWQVRAPYSNRRYASETLNGVRVLRCPILLNTTGSGIWRLLAPLSFALAAAPAVFWRIVRARPHVVLCVEPTLLSAPAAVLAAKLIGARRVLHVQDLEVDAAFAVGHLKGGIARRLAFAFERFMLRRFQAVVTISERMRGRLETKGVPAARLRIVRNWVDTDRIKPLEGPNPFRAELGLSEDDFVVLYAGQIGPKQALHVVFEAAEKFQDETRIHFVVAGDGPLKSRFAEQYGGRPNVHFLPLQPEERLCELLGLADLHVLPQDRNAADLVLPSKLGGMLASGRPVLAMAGQGTELRDVLQGAALLIEPGDAEALTGAIRAATQDRYPDISARAAELVEFFGRGTNLEQFARTIGGKN